MTNRLDETSLLARALEVGTRVPEQVADASSGLLLETMLGRYLVDVDGERVWLLIDGRRTVRDIAMALEAQTGRPAEEIRGPLDAFLQELLSLGLVEVIPQTSQAVIGS